MNLPAIETLIRRAGSLMRNPGSVQIHAKEGHANFVTSCDLAVQKMLIDGLKDLMPNTVFLPKSRTTLSSQMTLPG